MATTTNITEKRMDEGSNIGSNRSVKYDGPDSPIKRSGKYMNLDMYLYESRRNNSLVTSHHFLSRKERNKLAHALNGNTKWNEVCVRPRQKDGALDDLCKKHSHRKRATSQQEEKKKEAEGAKRRILEKFTEVCKLANCTIAEHLHPEEEDNEDYSTFRGSNTSHPSKLQLIPIELDVVNGMVDWDCLLDLEARHVNGEVFDLRHNASPTGEDHHRCNYCLRFVVRLSGAHHVDRRSRPCYECYGLDTPAWYILEDKRSSLVAPDPYDEDELLPRKPHGSPQNIYTSDDEEEITITHKHMRQLQPRGPLVKVATHPTSTPTVKLPLIPTIQMPQPTNELPSAPSQTEAVLEPVILDPPAQSQPAQSEPPAVSSSPVEISEELPEVAPIEPVFIDAVLPPAPVETVVDIFEPGVVEDVVPEDGGPASNNIQNFMLMTIYNPVFRSALKLLSGLNKKMKRVMMWCVLLVQLLAFPPSWFCAFVLFIIFYLMLIPYSVYGFLFSNKPVVKSLLTFETKAEPVTPRPYLSYYIAIQLVLPITVLWFGFDMLLWPTLCIMLSALLESAFGTVFGYASGMAVFQLENILCFIYLFFTAKLFGKLTTGFSCSRRYRIVDPDEQPGKGNRPKKASFGKVEYTMDIKDMVVTEVYSFSIDCLAISYDFFAVDLKERKICGTAFLDEAAVNTGRLTRNELKSSVQKSIEKAGYIEWDREYMAKHSVMRNTVEAIVAYNDSHDVEDVKNPLSKLNFILMGASHMRPWWTVGRVNQVICFFSMLSIGFGFIFMAIKFVAFVQTLFALAGSLLGLAGSFLGMSAALIKSVNFPPVAVAYDMNPETYPPVGSFGYRVYDDIAGRWDEDHDEWLPMKTNEVGDNKDLRIYQDIKVADPRTISRKVMGCFAPWTIPGICMPEVDGNCPLTFFLGLIHRGAGKTPTPDQAVLDSKKEYVVEILESMVPPASEDEVLDVEEALAGTSYTEARKETIRGWEDDAIEFDEAAVKTTASFGKKEKSKTPDKHGRTIHGAHEITWAGGIFGSLGRFVKTLEHVVYASIPANIKQMKPEEQNEKISNLGPGSKTANDFSSYEASFSREVQESAQFVAYDHYYQNTSYAESVPKHARTMLGGQNTLKTKFGNGSIKNLKCSGDFDTSFSNWFDNFCTICHIFMVKFQVHWTDCMDWILCEGDDNITDDHGFELTNLDFEKYGMTAKVEGPGEGLYMELEDAGFCQKHINPITGTQFGDPIRYLGKTVDIPIEYIDARMSKKLGMMKAKSMSTLATMQDAPVISEYAWRLLELTEGIYVSEKMRKKAAKWGAPILSFSNFRKPVIKHADRLAVSEVFGFTLTQQAEFTQALLDWKGGPLVLPLGWFPDVWVRYYDEYATHEKESDYQGWGNPGFYDYFVGRLSQVTK